MLTLIFISAISAPDPTDWISSVPALYRRVVPSHQSIVEQNPPSFWWSGYQSIGPSINFTVSLWANATSTDANPQWTFTTSVNYLNIPFTLPVGTQYLWQVTRVTVSSGTSVPSAARSFYLSPTALPFVVPSTVIEDVKKSAHPRLLLKGAARSAWLASDLGTSFKSRLPTVNIDSYFGVALPPTPTALYTDYPNSDALAAAASNDYHQFVQTINFSIRNLIVAHWYNPTNTTVLAELKRRTIAFANANPNGTTSHKVQDQANRLVLLALAQSYDLIGNSFNTSEKSLIVSVIVNRANQMYNAYSQFTSLLISPHDSHGQNNLGYIAQVAIAMLGEVPEADQWATSIPMNFNLYSSWSAEDGGFGNGFGYAYWDAYGGPRWDFFEWATGVKMNNKQFIVEWPKQFVYFGPYAAIRGGLGFGDDGEKDMIGAMPVVCNNLISRVVYNHPDIYEAELYNYYCSQFPRYSQILSFRYDDTIWSADFKNVTTLTKDYPKSIHLKTAGWAAFHSSLTEYNRTALFFKSSKYGSYNHNSADQLSFTMVHKGQQMFIASGHYDSYMSPQHKNWRKQTIAMTGGVTMDGGIGQAFDTMEASGNITQYATTNDYDYVTGDALLAYNAGLATDSELLLTRAIRSLVYLRAANQFLIFDQFDAVSPRQFEWNFHANVNFTEISHSPLIIQSTKGGVSTCLKLLYSSTPVTFWQTDQFPSNANTTLPNQAHGQFKFSSKATSASFVILIDPDCTGSVPQIKQSSNNEWSFDINDTHVIFNGNELIVKSPDSNNDSPNGQPSAISRSSDVRVSVVIALVSFTMLVLQM